MILLSQATQKSPPKKQKHTHTKSKKQKKIKKLKVSKGLIYLNFEFYEYSKAKIMSIYFFRFCRSIHSYGTSDF